MRLQRVTSQDISKFPDQAAYKLNRLIDEVERLVNQQNNTP